MIDDIAGRFLREILEMVLGIRFDHEAQAGGKYDRTSQSTQKDGPGDMATRANFVWQDFCWRSW